jgi:hypothetical protein
VSREFTRHSKTPHKKANFEKMLFFTSENAKISKTYVKILVYLQQNPIFRKKTPPKSHQIDSFGGADELILLLKTRKHPILEAEMINLYQILRQKRVEPLNFDVKNA